MFDAVLSVWEFEVSSDKNSLKNELKFFLVGINDV